MSYAGKKVIHFNTKRKNVRQNLGLDLSLRQVKTFSSKSLWSDPHNLEWSRLLRPNSSSWRRCFVQSFSVEKSQEQKLNAYSALMARCVCIWATSLKPLLQLSRSTKDNSLPYPFHQEICTWTWESADGAVTAVCIQRYEVHFGLHTRLSRLQSCLWAML